MLEELEKERDRSRVWMDYKQAIELTIKLEELETMAQDRPNIQWLKQESRRVKTAFDRANEEKDDCKALELKSKFDEVTSNIRKEERALGGLRRRSRKTANKAKSRAPADTTAGPEGEQEWHDVSESSAMRHSAARYSIEKNERNIPGVEKECQGESHHLPSEITHAGPTATRPSGAQAKAQLSADTARGPCDDESHQSPSEASPTRRATTKKPVEATVALFVSDVATGPEVERASHGEPHRSPPETSAARPMAVSTNLGCGS